MGRFIAAIAAALLAIGTLAVPASASPQWAYDCWAYSATPWYSSYMVYGKGRGYCQAPYGADIYHIKLTVKIQQQYAYGYKTIDTASKNYWNVDSGQYVGWYSNSYHCYAPYNYAWFRTVVVVSAYDKYGTPMGKAKKTGPSKRISC
jgi:hypothetical protein